MRRVLLTAAVVLSGLFFLSSDAFARGPSTYSGYVQSRLTGHSSHHGSHYAPRTSYYRHGSNYGRSYGYHSYRPHYDWHDTSHYDYHPGGFQRHGNHFHYVPGHYDYHRDGHWDFHR